MKKILVSLIFMGLTSSLYAFDPEALVGLSDQALFDAALRSNAGKCIILDASKSPPNPNHAATAPDSYCDFYALTQQSYSSMRTKTEYTGNMGLPHGNGFGCVIAPNHPRKFTKCSNGKYERYDKYSNDPMTSICTNDYIKNGANMIRIAIINGLCDPDVFFQAVKVE